MKPYETILQQLGGNKFIAMTGANKLGYSDEGYTFKFWFKMCRKANICNIHLNSSDLYDVTFYQFSKKNATVTAKKVHNDIYAEDLQRIFTEYTGLDTHL